MPHKLPNCVLQEHSQKSWSETRQILSDSLTKRKSNESQLCSPRVLDPHASTTLVTRHQERGNNKTRNAKVILNHRKKGKAIKKSLTAKHARNRNKRQRLLTKCLSPSFPLPQISYILCVTIRPGAQTPSRPRIIKITKPKWWFFPSRSARGRAERWCHRTRWATDSLFCSKMRETNKSPFPVNASRSSKAPKLDNSQYPPQKSICKNSTDAKEGNIAHYSPSLRKHRMLSPSGRRLLQRAGERRGGGGKSRNAAPLPWSELRSEGNRERRGRRGMRGRPIWIQVCW